jgi:hypothetical protein
LLVPDLLKPLPQRPGRELRAYVVRVVSVPLPRLNGTRFKTLLVKATTRAAGVGQR